MPTIREIWRRIRSVSDTAKITRAMEMVAASKMRRGPEAHLASRHAAGFALENSSVEVKAVAVGRKGRDFLLRAGIPLVAEFVNLEDYPSFDDIRPIARLLMDEDTSGGGG